MAFNQESSVGFPTPSSLGAPLDAALGTSLDRQQLLRRYRSVRQFSETLAAPLSPEDCVIQSMPDVSPTRWHLAHTTWFFETFVLAAAPEYEPFDPAYEHLFNSYYNTVGRQFPRSRRGLLSRPTLEEAFAYRKSVDGQIENLLDPSSSDLKKSLLSFLELGLHHEQQHQELILTDIKHVLSCNPLFPSYHPDGMVESDCEDDDAKARAPSWISFDADIYRIGHDGDGFAFDNESPRHRVFLEPFELASQPVANRDFLAFMEDGGYERPELWLSAGWAQVQEQQWNRPLYWTYHNGAWRRFTLSGLQAIAPTAPVCHVSYFEADAFARWSGARLPTEAEWEVAARKSLHNLGRFAEEEIFDPAPAVNSFRGPSATQPTPIHQLLGDVWEWTSSSYSPYPGYCSLDGALGEYNGKFMCNQYVLRGGSCATPRSHIRPTYRNFFPPDARWQFSGLRLARSV